MKDAKTQTLLNIYLNEMAFQPMIVKHPKLYNTQWELEKEIQYFQTLANGPNNRTALANSPVTSDKLGVSIKMENTYTLWSSSRKHL